MAKITAGGAHEVARFRHRTNGTLYLVRSDGAVLRKWAVKGSGWSLLARPQVDPIEDRVRACLNTLRNDAQIEEVR